MLKVLYVLLLFLVFNIVSSGRDGERGDVHRISRVIGNYVGARLRLILRCVPHRGEAHPVPGLSINTRGRDYGREAAWQGAQAGLPLPEWLTRTADSGPLTVSLLLPPGH